MPYLFAINYLDTQQVFFLNINWQGEREGRKEEEAFGREVQSTQKRGCGYPGPNRCCSVLGTKEL